LVDAVWQLLAALWRVGVGAIFGERILPFATCQNIQPSQVAALDGLSEAAFLLPHPKRQSLMPECQVRRIVIGADQAARRSGGRGCEGCKRALQIGKVGRLGAQLEFDLRRDIPPPLLSLGPARANAERRRLIRPRPLPPANPDLAVKS
jgi:hypothetical protein